MSKALRSERMWDMVRHFLGLQLVMMRESRGWTVAELAAKAEVTPKVISTIESGNGANVALTTFVRIAKAFNVAFEVRLVPFSFYFVPSRPFDETAKPKADAKVAKA